MTTIEINLGKAYYNQGFFNIRVRYNHLIAENDEEISVQLENKIFITAKVNRTANRNGTPRIMCGEIYTNWIQKNFRQGDVMKVNVINKNFLKIIKK